MLAAVAELVGHQNLLFPFPDGLLGSRALTPAEVAATCGLLTGYASPSCGLEVHAKECQGFFPSAN
jgi:hypothetical protein